MAFTETLFPASFRGVPFSTTASTITVGRRTHVFEYPQRDIPFVEDLGKAARQITLTAVFAGPDYITGMNRLIAAMEEEGSGELVHPMLGSMQVTPTNLSKVTFDSKKLGYSSADLTFTESGEYQFPSSATDTKSASVAAGEAIKVSAINCYRLRGLSETWNDVQDFVKEAVRGNLSELLGLTQVEEVWRILDKSDEAAKLASTALGLLEYEPKVFAEAVVNAFGFSRSASSVSNWRRVTRILSRLTESYGFTKSYKSSASSTTDDAEVATRSAAVQSLSRQAVLSEAVTASALVGTEDDSSGEAMAYEDVMSLRDEVLEALDAEMLLADDDGLYQSLVSARAAVWKDMTDKAEDSAHLVGYKPSEVMPALVLAYDYYEDPSREAEIIARNNIRHGGFVPAKELKLLSR